MALVAERSEAEILKRKTYIRYDANNVCVRRQETLKRNKCDSRKVCGTYGRVVSRKRRD